VGGSRRWKMWEVAGRGNKAFGVLSSFCLGLPENLGRLWMLTLICVVTPCTEGESILELRGLTGPQLCFGLKCFLGSTGALQHRGIRDPGLSVRGVFFPLWFWLLIRIALCL